MGKAQRMKRPLLPRVVVVMILIILASSLYTISPEDMGVVHRFGRPFRAQSPGLNFRIPFGIEKGPLLIVPFV
jgi:membrane protease subunit HflK